MSLMGFVSKVVEVGFFDQLSKLCVMIMNDAVNPTKTAHTQKTLAYFVVVEIYTNPCMVEDSRKSLMFSMFICLQGMIAKCVTKLTH